MNNYRSSFLSNIPPVVKNLIIVNAIVFLATTLTPNLLSRLGTDLSLTDVLGLHFWQSSQFSPFQFISYMFVHGGFTHLFFNMFALYMFGGVLESFWGPKRFLIYYLITGVGAGIVQQIFWSIEINHVAEVLKNSIDLNIPITVGASGAVFGLLLAFGWLFPEQRLFVFPIPVPIKARVFVSIYGLLELFLGVAQFSGDSVAHFAHLGGMLFGIILILYWKKKRIL
jgi:membrane associated rhomboid family serine protease